MESKTSRGGRKSREGADSLVSAAVKTVVPKEAITGVKLDKTKGGSLRVASGEVFPNLGSTKLKGTGTLGGSPLQVEAHVADITKPLASVDEMGSSGMRVIMHRSGGIAKRLDSDTERLQRLAQIRDLVKGCRGSEIVLERSGGSFTFEIDVNADEAGWSTQNKRPAKPGSRMEVDEAVGGPSYCDSLWGHEHEELECTPCGSLFHRH